MGDRALTLNYGTKFTSVLGSGKAVFSGHFCSNSKKLLSSCLSYVFSTTLVSEVYVSEVAGTEICGICLDPKTLLGWMGRFSERIFMAIADVSSGEISLVWCRFLAGWGSWGGKD